MPMTSNRLVSVLSPTSVSGSWPKACKNAGIVLRFTLLYKICQRLLKIKLDLDVLDPTAFRSRLFANPEIPPNAFEGVIDQLVRLLADVNTVADIVGIDIAEHLSWDALALKNMLAKPPLIGSPAN
jgi:hypothetical protein